MKAKPMPRPAKRSAALPEEIAVRNFLLHLALCLLVLGLVALAFLPTFSNSFIVYDDELYVTANPQVRRGLTWAGVTWAFHSFDAQNWHPLTWLSHMLDTQLFGSRAGGHHATSLVLHACNSLLLFGLLKRMTGALMPSFIAASLFAVHPLHVESVAWVAERKDVLSAFFFLLTMVAYQEYARRLGPEAEGKSHSKSHRPWIFYAAALVFFILGLMSKAMVVTLPFVLLLLDYWPLRRLRFASGPGPKRRLVFLDKIPFVLLSAAGCWVAFEAQRRGGAVIDVARLPLSARVENAAIACARYLQKLFWPADLSIFYPHPGHWPIVAVLCCAALLIGLTVFALYVRKSRPWAIVGWLWFIGMLIPVLGLVQVGRQAMADRYMYLPMVGILMILSWGLTELAKLRGWGRFALGTATVLALIVCTFASYRQTALWKNSETIFEHAIAVTRNNYIAHNNLGIALLRADRLDEAELHFKTAVAIKPDDAEGHANLGNVLCRKERVDEGIQQLRIALQLKPDSVETHHNLGIILCRQGALDQGIAELEQATRLRPNSPEGRLHLGMALAMKGRRDDAIQQFNKALELRPNYPEAERYLQAIKAQPNPR